MWDKFLIHFVVYFATIDINTFGNLLFWKYYEAEFGKFHLILSNMIFGLILFIIITRIRCFFLSIRINTVLFFIFINIGPLWKNSFFIIIYSWYLDFNKTFHFSFLSSSYYVAIYVADKSHCKLHTIPFVIIILFLEE